MRLPWCVNQTLWLAVSEKPVNLCNKSKVASHVFLNVCILI